MLTDNSPYRLTDVTISRTRLAELQAAAFDTPQNVQACFTLPSSPLPILTPDAVGGEMPRRLTLATLPFIYLPASIWLRQPAEPLGAYQMRLLVALDMMNLLDRSDTSIRFKPVEHAPDDEQSARELFNRLDAGGMSPLYRVESDRMGLIISRVWPDGYPLEDMLQVGRWLMGASMQVSVTLTVLDAIQLGENAPKRLELVRREYGGLFAVDKPTPQSVRAWLKNSQQSTLSFAQGMADMGVEADDFPDAIRSEYVEAGVV